MREGRATSEVRAKMKRKERKAAKERERELVEEGTCPKTIPR